MVAKRLAEVSAADYVAIGLAHSAYPEGTALFEAVTGLGIDHISGRPSSKQGLTAQVMDTGVPVVSRNITEVEGYNPPPEVTKAMSVLGLGMYLPLKAGGKVCGVLVAGWRRGSPREDLAAEDVPMMEMFAGQAALALQQLQARLMVEADRDRIAKELSVAVINRLFAIGTHLHGAVGLIQIQPAQAQQLMDEAIEGLDETIQQIRTATFELHPDRAPQQRSVSDRLLEELDAASATLGFTPCLVVEGLVDRTLPERHQRELVRAVYEALSNAATHTNLSQAEVVVRVTGSQVTLTVTDNGQVDARQPLEGVLGQLRTGAEQLGGTCRVRAGESTGTVTCWEVPLFSL